MDAAASTSAALRLAGLGVGDVDRDDTGEMGDLRPEEKDDRDRERKNGEDDFSGVPSSSAYRSCEMEACGTQFCGASPEGRMMVNSNLAR